MNYQNDKPIEYDIYQISSTPDVRSFRFAARESNVADKRFKYVCKMCLLCCVIIGVIILGISSVVFIWSLQELVKKMTTS